MEKSQSSIAEYISANILPLPVEYIKFEMAVALEYLNRLSQDEQAQSDDILWQQMKAFCPGFSVPAVCALEIFKRSLNGKKLI